MFPILSFGSIRIGRVFGIDIEINYTWFIIFALVTFNLSYIFYVEQKFSLVVSTVDGLITSLLFFSSILLHELSHSFVAARNQIPIKKVTLFIFGGIAQMSKEPDSPKIEFKMAVAGPLASLALAGLFGGAWLVLGALGMGPALYSPFQFLSFINLLLAAFNLAPGFPLDGGRVLRAALWYYFKDIRRATQIASRAGQVLAFLLIFIGLVRIFYGDYGGFWLIIIGWFLSGTAQASYRQLLLERSLSGVKVKEIMTDQVVIVDPEITLDRLVEEYFLRYKYGRFPVISKEERLLGVITLHDVKEVPRSEWFQRTAGEIVSSLKAGFTVRPDEEAAKALIQMAREDIGHLLVVENSSLVGLVTRTDIIRLIKIKSELGM